ncbi:MAG: NAD-dependent epimerase/dehydratase family protein [Planctomycetes bacterium]|nr:NAD-dependent epimerase/dehydratase family protein [Planctomycetota bacterium]
MRCLVTGGAGFIGSNLAHTLVRRGDSVRILDDLSTGRRQNLAGIEDAVDFRHVDLRDADAVARAMEGIEVVFHLGGLNSVPRSLKNPLATHQANVSGTVNILWSARRAGTRRVVFASSSSVYGDHEAGIDREELPLRPKAPYSVSKVAGELYAKTFTRNYGLETVCLRLFNVFGPRQNPASEYAAVIPRFILALSRGEPVTLFGDGTQSRDFTFVENVVHAHLLAATAPAAGGESINVACGASWSLRDLVARLEGILGVRATVRTEPQRAGDRRHSEADISKARRLLGYSVQVDFAEGLRKSAAWYRESGGA